MMMTGVRNNLRLKIKGFKLTNPNIAGYYLYKPKIYAFLENNFPGSCYQ